MDACGASAECQGFQYCFPAPGTAGNAIGRIRLKGGSLGALNISEAIYNPYCRSPPPLSPGAVKYRNKAYAICIISVASLVLLLPAVCT